MRQPAMMAAADVTAVSVVDDVLRRELLACWTDVSNAGGAVGFVPPVTEDDVAPVLDKLLEGVHSGRDVLALLTVDGEVAGFAALVGSSSPLRRHWAMVLRVQVHPSRQGAGLGRVLMTGVHDIARAHGWEFLSPERPRRHRRRGFLQAGWATPSTAGCPAPSASRRATTARRSC